MAPNDMVLQGRYRQPNLQILLIGLPSHIPNFLLHHILHLPIIVLLPDLSYV
jgi:hypothetical protein